MSYKFNMKTQSSNHRRTILEFIKSHPAVSSKEIHDEIADEVGYATVKRILQKLITENLISSNGNGRGTKYEISPVYNLLHFVDVDIYFKKEIDARKIKSTYDQSLISKTLKDAQLFTNDELNQLNDLQNQFKANSSKLSKSEFQKELERLVIDLSWKSSQIEGNTYSLLQTERLLKEKETASGKSKDEAVMLLNHKAALDFIIAHPTYVKPISISRIEDIHSMLIKDLGIDRNIRKRRVGISGTNYKPLDNEFQIREALVEMSSLINKQQNIFAKAILALVLISYIQPFNDGNKRTARIICNAILINNMYCPMSFRTVDSVEYKMAMLIFYEQNNISVFKEIFINQFEFAVKTYF